MFYFDEAKKPFQSDAAKIRDVSEFGAPPTKATPNRWIQIYPKKNSESRKARERRACSLGRCRILYLENRDMLKYLEKSINKVSGISLRFRGICLEVRTGFSIFTNVYSQSNYLVRMHTVTLIPGDGIGPSIAEAAQRVIEATGVEIQWEFAPAGIAAIETFKDPIPESTIQSIQKNKVALKGPLTTLSGKGFRSINVALRKEFDLFINLRPAKSFEGVSSRYANVDLVMFRENIEEFYSGIEHYVDAQKSAAETIGIVTRFGSERIVHAAFEYARKYGRKK